MQYFRLLIMFCCGVAISLLPIKACSQAYPFNFHHRGNLNENGLNFVNDILFDSKQRVWIGGQTGFYRYDGKHYLPYFKTNHQHALPSNFVHALCEDKQGNIWGGTDDGIFRFSPEQQSFRAYSLPGNINNPSAMNILTHPDGNIWVANFSNLYRFNIHADSFDVIAPLWAASESGQNNRIKKRGIQASPNGKHIWATTDEGIFYFDIAAKKWKNISNHPDLPLFAKRNTSAMTQGLNGSLFFFDINDQKVIFFDPHSFAITKTISIKHKVPNANAAFMFQSKDEKIWFSSWTNHTAVIDLAAGDRVISLNASANDPFALTSNFFWCAKQDSDGNIWLGTTDGIFITNQQKELFRVHAFSKMINGIDESTHLQLFLEDGKDHSWWIVTSKQDLIHYNPFNGQYSIVHLSSAIPDEIGNRPVSPTSLCYMNGRIVISGNEGAWVCEGEALTIVPINQALNITLPITVRRMVRGQYDDYLITDGNDVYRVSANMKDLKKLFIKTKNPPEKNTITLFKSDTEGRAVYCAIGRGGIGRVDADTIYGTEIIKDPGEMVNWNIRDIKADSKGNVWICYTNLALMRYNPANGNIKRWDETNGLILNAIGRLAIDQKDNVWAMHKRHFSILLSGSERFFNLSFQKGELYPAWSDVIHLLYNGKIVANNYNDLVEFFPSRLFQKPNIYKPDISALYVDEVRIKHEIDSLIKLLPEQNTLRFSFGILTDRTFFPFLLQYKLDGADKNWKTATSTSEAVYNKLPPGKYIFRVKGISENGTWETPESTLEVKIEKPLYKTNLFWAIITILLSGILYSVFRIRLKQHQRIYTLETKAASLEREKATIQYDSLKQQLNPHFLFNSLTSLAGLIESDQEMAGNFLQRMSDMYRYILKNGEHDTVKLGDELRFVHLYIDIQQTRFGEGLMVHVDVPDEYREYGIAPVTLQNMVENAIKHNIIDAGMPLRIGIYIEKDYIVVSNNLQRKNMVESSNKTGLIQFQSLYKYLSEKPVIIEEGTDHFTVKVPLL
jgi:streptogramin lyase